MGSSNVGDQFLNLEMCIFPNRESYAVFVGLKGRIAYTGAQRRGVPTVPELPVPVPVPFAARACISISKQECRNIPNISGSAEELIDKSSKLTLTNRRSLHKNLLNLRLAGFFALLGRKLGADI